MSTSNEGRNEWFGWAKENLPSYRLSIGQTETVEKLTFISHNSLSPLLSLTLLRWFEGCEIQFELIINPSVNSSRGKLTHVKETRADRNEEDNDDETGFVRVDATFLQVLAAQSLREESLNCSVDAHHQRKRHHVHYHVAEANRWQLGCIHRVTYENHNDLLLEADHQGGEDEWCG